MFIIAILGIFGVLAIRRGVCEYRGTEKWQKFYVKKVKKGHLEDFLKTWGIWEILLGVCLLCFAAVSYLIKEIVVLQEQKDTVWAFCSIIFIWLVIGLYVTTWEYWVKAEKKNTGQS